MDPKSNPTPIDHHHHHLEGPTSQESKFQVISPSPSLLGGLRVFCDFLWIWILKARAGHLGINFHKPRILDSSRWSCLLLMLIFQKRRLIFFYREK